MRAYRKGEQIFQGGSLFHAKVEIFVPGGTNISGVQILRDRPRETRLNMQWRGAYVCNSHAIDYKCSYSKGT